MSIGYILGLYRDNGKEHGNYKSKIRCIWGYMEIMEKNMEPTVVK